MAKSETIKRLSIIKGLGKKTIDSITAIEPDILEKILQNDDFMLLARMAKITPKRAITVINALKGIELNHEFFGTKRVEEIYSKIKDMMASYCKTQYSINFVSSIFPLIRVSDMMERMAWVMKCKEYVSAMISHDKISALTDAYRYVREFNDAVERLHINDRTIVVESDEDYNRMRSMGITRYIDVITPDYGEYVGDGIIIYAYSTGRYEDAFSNSCALVSLPIDTIRNIWDLVPEYIIALYERNMETIKACVDIGQILNMGVDSCKKALDIMASIGVSNVMETDDIQRYLDEWCSCVNHEIEDDFGKRKLNGKEILEALKSGSSRAIDMAVERAIKNNMSKLRKNVPESILRPFPIKRIYPLSIDEKVLMENIRKYRCDFAINEFYRLKMQAEDLSHILNDVKKEIITILHRDLDIAIGRFALEFDLKPFEFTESGIYLRGCGNLELLKQGVCERIDYHIGYNNSEERIVLLTGANSGGKTTLLETITQIYLLAYMGFPVPAYEAKLEYIDALVYYTHSRTLGAGAFESFLKRFLPLCTTSNKVLLLADEIEAMTELDASAKIIATFIDELKNTDSMAIIVTHLGDEILRYTKVRVDGIEAEGLDQNYELKVNRTPKINYRAKSTPELILQRIYNQMINTHSKNNKLVMVIEKILRKF